MSVSEVNSAPSSTSSLLEVGPVLDDPVHDHVHAARRCRRAGGSWPRSPGRGWPSGCGRCRCSASAAGAVDRARARCFRGCPRRARSRLPAVLEQRQAGGVIAAVLELLEPGHEDLLAGARARVSDDSAHGRLSRVAPRSGAELALDHRTRRCGDRRRTRPRRAPRPSRGPAARCPTGGPARGRGPRAWPDSASIASQTAVGAVQRAAVGDASRSPAAGAASASPARSARSPPPAPRASAAPTRCRRPRARSRCR